MSKSDLERELDNILYLALRDDYGWWLEYKFHPTRRWRFDFAFKKQMVAVEVEGGIWSGGRHTRGSGFEKDCEKYNEAAILGWLVIRVTGSMIESGEALGYVERALKARPDAFLTIEELKKDYEQHADALRQARPASSGVARGDGA